MIDCRLRRLDASHPEFDAQLRDLLAWNESVDADIHQRVGVIIEEVRRRGDDALIEFTRRFDRYEASSPAELELSQGAMRSAWESLTPGMAKALELAAQRIRAHAEHQKLESWTYTESDGTVLGQQVKPLDRVGIYVPGGKAAYPSSVLMNAIPAHVAGVDEIIMVTPTPDGEVNELVLAAAYLAGVTRV